MLEPIKHNILFVFLQKTNKAGSFVETTSWGFEMSHDEAAHFENTAKNGRWAKVVSCGPDVNREEIAPGQYIFIEPLMWTTGMTFDGVKIWKTDPTKVMLVSDDFPEVFEE